MLGFRLERVFLIWFGKRRNFFRSKLLGRSEVGEVLGGGFFSRARFVGGFIVDGCMLAFL